MDEEQKRLAEELLFSEKKRPSFVKRLYFGCFDAPFVFPFPKPSKQESEETQAFVTKVMDFAQKEIDPVWIDRHSDIPDNVIRGLAKLGALGVTIGKEYGGLGLTQYAYCRMAEALAPHCCSTALFVNVHNSIGIKTLELFGTPEQKQKYLPGMARGELIGAFALTEPNAGSDAAGVQTRAVYDPEKKVYRLTGEKQWITNGGIAQVLTVLAKMEVQTKKGTEDKITAFLVTPDMPGFIVTNPALDKVGMRGTKTAKLAFKDMVVPAENIIGPIGGGLRVCLTDLDYGRSVFGAMCTGCAKFLLRRAIDQARNRYQFQRPIGSFSLVKRKIARIASLTYAMDAANYLTAGLIDAKVEDIMLEAAILKVFVSDALWEIIYETMQIHGGRCLFADEPFERMMRDARLNMIGEGANEVLRAFIAVVGLRDVGMQLKEALGDIGKLWTASKNVIQRLWRTPEVPVQMSILQPEAHRLAKSVQKFGRAALKAVVRCREGVLEEQLLLNRLATSAIALYTSTAVLSKLDSDLVRVGGDISALGNDVVVGRFHCRESFVTIDHCLNYLFSKEDKVIEDLSDRITGIRKYG